MPFASSGVRIAVAAALALAALAAALCFAARSQAAETVYWNNYSADPDSIAFAGIDGAGGGPLNLGTATLSGPEGMAYDTVTNRLFVASSSDDRIVALNLDGSGGADFSAPGALIDSPQGLVVDPETRTVYWINSELESISWARLDGSVGGVVDTGGVEVDADRLSLDPVAKRLYWFDGTADTVASVSTAGGAVAPLNTAGATLGSDSNGIAVEPGLGKVFWLNSSGEAVSWASLAGTGGGDIPVPDPALEGAYGLSVDAAAGRVYWANYGAGEDRTNGLGFFNLAGGFAPISVLSAPVDGPQDPVLIKPPFASAPPAITRGTGTAKAQLTCPTGTWAADASGAFVYRAPRTYAYQWTRGGAPLSGAVGSALTATSPGSYACTITATNQAGSAASTSAAVTVKAAKFKLLLKTKKAKAKVGERATFKIQALNQGDLKSTNSRICPKLTKAQKQVLKQPKCKKLGKVVAGKRKAAKLKIKVKAGATGTYKIKLVPKGTGGKAVSAKLQVIG
ncbi:MAG: hypothetical protein QOE75_599 [Solirubrobacterales bacterium]|nr:hypothetical protein [Solirubrobacterales bacterium]